jgi:hypothetical protein
MSRKIALVFGSGLVAAGLVLSTSYAQDQKQRMPSNHGMMGGKGTMMGNPQMRAQMQRMMENCNKMMERYMQQSPSQHQDNKG